jgi:hypothetical protein
MLFQQLLIHPLSLPMTWYTTYYLQLDSNWAPPSSQGSALTLLHHKKPFPSPFNLHVHKTFKEIKIPLKFNDLRDLWCRFKNRKIGCYGRCRIPYVIVVKISDSFFFFEIYVPFQSSTCSICMADFQAWFRPWWWSLLDLSFINKINLINP